MEEFLTNIFSSNILFALPLFIVIRALVIVIPPIPGVLIDIPGILVFGWVLGFIYAEIGIMLGAMVAFWIARKYREPLVRRFVPLQKLNKWENRLSENQKFWALVAIRLPTNPLFDYISYAAGLTKISSMKFFFTTLIGNVPSMFLLYYFGGVLFNQRIYYGVAFVVAIIIFWFVLRTKTTGLSEDKPSN